jgi:hypothetical protein
LVNQKSERRADVSTTDDLQGLASVEVATQVWDYLPMASTEVPNLSVLIAIHDGDLLRHIV